MDHPTFAGPGPTPPDTRTRDPLAAALGNASLLGIGYLMLGRRRLALAAGVVTVVLVWVLVAVAQTWCEVLVLLWWAAVIVHGWFLAAGGTRRAAPRKQRLAALGVTVVIVLAVGFLRFEAAGIQHDITDAREAGNCASVLSAQHRLWFGARVADAPLTARSDQAIDACRRLRTAKTELTMGLAGNIPALKAGFDTLASALAEPGNDKTTDAVLTGFLGGLPTTDPCRTAAVTDWLRDRHPSHNALDRAAGAVPRTAPAALAGCGDGLMTDTDFTNARTRYQQLLDQYPGDPLAAKARDGVKRATQQIELSNVTTLLQGSTDSQPTYCSYPAKYSAAAPYGKGTNRALFYGNDTYTSKLPASWRTTNAAHAVLVICMGKKTRGTAVRTCPYTSKGSFGTSTRVTFHKIAIKVTVYELNTGKRVTSRKVQINGTSCPSVIHYKTLLSVDAGPDPDMYVSASKADVRAAFSPLINR